MSGPSEPRKISKPADTPESIGSRDAAIVRRYVMLLNERAIEAGETDAGVNLDRRCELLLALSRALSGEALAAHTVILQRATGAILDDGGRQLCDEAERLWASHCPEDRDDASTLGGLGRALLELRSRFEQR
jgi:hypothetical protein